MDIVYEKKVNKMLDEAKINSSYERQVVMDKIEFLLKQNEQVLETIDVRILAPYYNDLSNFLSMLTVYPEVQNQIATLSVEQYKLFATIVNEMDKNDLDWISVAEDYLFNIKSGEYYELFLDKSMKDKIDNLYQKSNSNIINKKDADELEQITALLTNKNFFKIQKYSDIKNFNVNKKYNDLLIGNIKDEYYEKLDKIDKYKHVILLKQFGHGLDSAKFMMDRYGNDYKQMMELIEKENDKEIYDFVTQNKKINDINEIKSEIERIKGENQAVKQYMTALKSIIDTKDLNILKNYYTKINNKNTMNVSYRMDSTLRKFFARERNKELYIPKDSDKIQIDSQNVYMIQGDYKIASTSLKSYSDALDWDCKLLKNHGLCTVLTANNNMNHAPVRGAQLGFTDFDEKSLLASAPWDMASCRFAEDMNIAKARTKGEKADIKFYLTNGIINRTRRRHNENLDERRELNSKKIDENNGKYKKQPSYVVYEAEPSLNNYILDNNEILTSENLKKYLDFNKYSNKYYRAGVVENYAKSDSCWKESIDESKKRNVNIVIIDRTYNAIRERLKIDDLEKQFLNFDKNQLESSPEKVQDFLKLMERIIVESENNRAGNNIRNDNNELVHKEIREKLFSKEIMNNRLEKIENKIKTLDINVQKQCYQQLKIITMNELEKYKHAYFEYDPGYDLQQYLEKKIIEELPPRNININNMLEEVDPITGKKGGEIIGEAIGDIKELDEYPSHSSSIHGQKHINNVVLFSYLIAKGEKQLVGDDLDLVIQAAKYHDVGRDGIWNGLGDGNREDGDEVKHANPSALAAEFYMNKEKNKDGSKKYNEQQIAMVQTAISYHEVNEKNHNEFNEEVFEQLCDKYNVDKKNNNVAKLICIYLKDADAVDRTRFMQDYEEDRNTIPEHRRYERRFYDGLDISYLRAPTSFYIVDEARKIHKEYLRKGCEQVFDEHGNYLENVSPKISIPEILKPYEYSIKNKTKDINNKGKIKKFLNDKQKEEEQEELKEFSKIYYDMDKSLLAKLRRRGKQILEKIRYVGKEKTR